MQPTIVCVPSKKSKKCAGGLDSMQCYETKQNSPQKRYSVRISDNILMTPNSKKLYCEKNPNMPTGKWNPKSSPEVCLYSFHLNLLYPVGAFRTSAKTFC